MALIQSGIQAGIFEQFYPTTLVYSAAKKVFFLGHTPQEKAYFIYSVNDKGIIDTSAPVHKGKLNSYLSNLQYVQDLTLNKQYIYGYNLEEKTIQFYLVQDNGSPENVYDFTFNATGMQIRTASFFVINGVLYYYYQYEKSKNWESFSVVIVK
ncbi:XRE family transcriptional regulator [Providencia vermicola]|uniref:XRE family transcriptional regulator n=1 Tax=Providencia vermicola TaxID=333965 RepID=UPI0034DD0623